MAKRKPSDLELVEAWWERLGGKPILGVWRVRPGALDDIDTVGELVIPDMGEIREVGILKLTELGAVVEHPDPREGEDALLYSTPYAVIEAGWRLD